MNQYRESEEYGMVDTQENQINSPDKSMSVYESKESRLNSREAYGYKEFEGLIPEMRKNMFTKEKRDKKCAGHLCGDPDG